ncbi:MAG: hypothetical protein LBD32_00375 [Cytophagales bacterium]|nr:hypothetical protein [Cytophagales bacterium]
MEDRGSEKVSLNPEILSELIAFMEFAKNNGLFEAERIERVQSTGIDC